MSCASCGLALPANTAIVERSIPESLVLHEPRLSLMAGAEGFEPPNGGIKTRCLTTWRRPNYTTRSWTRCDNQQRRAVQAAHNEARSSAQASAPGQPALRAHRAAPRTRRRRFRSALPRQIHEANQALQRSRIAAAHGGRAVVAATRREKGAYCRDGGITCQFRGLKDLRRAHCSLRFDHQIVPSPGSRPASAARRRLRPRPPSRARRTARRRRASARARQLVDRQTAAARVAFSATSTVAASELPPPRPPCTGMRLSSSMPTPAERRDPSRAARAAFTCRVGFGGNLRRSGDALDHSRRPLVKAQLVAQIDELHRRSAAGDSRRHDGRRCADRD